MDLYPKARFQYTGGIDGDRVPILGGWEVTLTHGLTPNTFYVQIPMQDGIPAPDKNGDVILTYGDIEPIRLKNCTIDKITQDRGGAKVWNVSILDRRYRWRWQKISGIYNARFRNGTDVREETKKKPSELAEFCLQAMLETDYDTEKLKDFDDTDWPEVNWDVANPAEELQRLCERYELRPVWDWMEDRIVVVKVGEGVDLDLDLPAKQYSGAFDPPEKPGKLVLVCGPSSVQYDFPLEAVALDADGKIKYPDEVTYAPTRFSPPSGQSPPDFTSGTIADEKWLPWAGVDDQFFDVNIPYLRRLALETMLKWYRIVPPEMMDGLSVIAGDNPDYAPQQQGTGASSGVKYPLGQFTRLSDNNADSWLWEIVLQGEQNDRLSTLYDPQNTQFDEYNNEVSQTPLEAWIYGQYLDEERGDNALPDELDSSNKPIPFTGLKKLNPKKVYSPPQQDASIVPTQDEPAEVQEKVRETGFYTGSFSIDSQHGIVKFGDAVKQYIAPKDSRISFKWADGTSFDDKDPWTRSQALFPATLFLRARFFVRNKTTRELIRYQKTRTLDPDSDTVRYVVRDDLTLRLTYRFDSDQKPLDTSQRPPSFPVVSTESNADIIDKALDQYLDQIEEQYETRRPETIVYVGFVPYTLDGAIRQVTWAVDRRGEASTRVSRDQEELHIVRDFQDRRLVERLKAVAAKAGRPDFTFIEGNDGKAQI